MISFSFFFLSETRPYYVAQDSLKLPLLLPLPHKSPCLLYYLHFSQGGAHVPFAVVACGIVLTAQTLPCHCVAVFSMTITLAGLAAGKAPIPRETSVTLPSIYALETVALASDGVTEGADRTLKMAVTSCRQSKQKLISQTDAPSRGSSPTDSAPGLMPSGSEQSLLLKAGKSPGTSTGIHYTVSDNTYVCIRWGRSRRCLVHTCCRFFQPR